MTALEELIQRAKTEAPELYERAMLEHYEATHGPHYDEMTGREAVACMHSTGSDGVERTGEHFGVELVKDAVRPFVEHMDTDDTIWDAYVALNMWWHDLARNYIRRGEESAIIEDAMTWAFLDEDAKAGKVWKYMHAVA